MTKQLFISFEKKPVFTCPHCFKFQSHRWRYLYEAESNIPVLYPLNNLLSGIILSTCNNCDKHTFWIKSIKADEIQVYPSNLTNYPPPHQDMPENIKKYYKEAGSVFQISLGSSAALARLTLENLLIELGYNDGTLNTKVSNFIAKEQPSEDIRKALDIIRIYGNSGAHSGIINLDERPEVPLKLLILVNLIVENTITIKKTIKELHDPIPTSIKENIDKRDSK